MLEMHMLRNRSLLIMAALSLVAGCAGKKLDVGGNAGGSGGAGPATAATGGGGPGGSSTGVGGTGTGGGTSGGWPSEDACQAGEQLPIVGTWQGYVENFMFYSGSDATKLVISHANLSSVCGKVTFGMGTPPPPPTDPNVGYPPGYDAGAPLGFVDRDVRRFEGFPMSVLGGRWSDPRLQFTATTSEVWKAWCELQTPYRRQVPGEYYMCVPYASSSHYTPAEGCVIDLPSGNVPIDCGKLTLCTMGMCTCTASGCTVEANGEITFDLRVAGNQMTGSVSLSGALHNLYLTRSP
jgi:hypothetical protein